MSTDVVPVRQDGACQVAELVEPQVCHGIVRSRRVQVDQRPDVALGTRERLLAEGFGELRLARLAVERRRQHRCVTPLHVLERVAPKQNGRFALDDVGVGNRLRRGQRHATDGIRERADAIHVEREVIVHGHVVQHARNCGGGVLAAQLTAVTVRVGQAQLHDRHAGEGVSHELAHLDHRVARDADPRRLAGVEVHGEHHDGVRLPDTSARHDLLGLAVVAYDGDGNHVLVQRVRLPVVLDGAALVVGHGAIVRLNIVGGIGLLHSALSRLHEGEGGDGDDDRYRHENPHDDSNALHDFLATRMMALLLPDEDFFLHRLRRIGGRERRGPLGRLGRRGGAAARLIPGVVFRFALFQSASSFALVGWLVADENSRHEVSSHDVVGIAGAGAQLHDFIA